MTSQLTVPQAFDEPPGPRTAVQRGFLRRLAQLPTSTRRALLLVAASDVGELQAVSRALAGMDLVFPAARGGYIDGEKFRYRQWTPALRAAGIEHRRVYDCRHTFASWAIAGGVQLFYLARIMGTSVAQIDATYGHLLPDSEGYLRGLLDAYDGVYGLNADQVEG